MKLWKHQEEAISFAQERGWRAALNMGVATGKTLTALSIVNRVFKGKTVYIVCPKTVIPQWVAEGQRHGLSLDVRQFEDGLTVHEKAKSLKDYTGKILVFNYDIIPHKSFKLALKKRPADLYILDESQRVGNSTSQTTSTLYKAIPKTAGVICLTGTFFHSSPLSCHGQVKLVDDTALDFLDSEGKRVKAGKYITHFKNRYGVYHNLPQVPVPVLKGFDNLDELIRNTRKVTYVVETTDVVDVPDEQHIDITNYQPNKVEYKKAERDLLLHLKENDYVLITSAVEKVVRLRQIVSGYKVNKLTGEVYPATNTAKLQTLTELVDSFADEKFIVFTVFRQEVDDVTDMLKSMGISHGRIVGGHSDLEAFQRGELQACVVNVQSGGSGVDLSQARLAVYYNHPYGLGDYTQTLGRIRRPNSTYEKVVYYHFYAPNTIEEDIVKALATKQDVNTYLIDSLKGQP